MKTFISKVSKMFWKIYRKIAWEYLNLSIIDRDTIQDKIISEYFYRMQQIICLLCLKFNRKFLWDIEGKHMELHICCQIAEDSIFE